MFVGCKPATTENEGIYIPIVKRKTAAHSGSRLVCMYVYLFAIFALCMFFPVRPLMFPCFRLNAQ